MFYASLSDIHSHWNIGNIKDKHKIWIAQYSSTIYPKKQKPDYDGQCHAWQYTNKGQVNVDKGVCYFENKKVTAKM